MNRHDRLAIARGYPASAHRKIAVDFDGTLYPFGQLMDEPAPLAEAAESLRRLAERGYRITIWTARLDPDFLAEVGQGEAEQREYIERLLHRDNIPHDRIVAKPAAEGYVDDRAIRFREGEWPAIVDWLLFASSDEPA